MTTKSKNAVRSYETDIERCREESNWKKAIDLAQQLKSKSPQHESLAHFLIGEGKLEAYLSEWPPSKDNIERAQRELSEARGYLTLATDEAGKMAGVALDAYLLLGKLNYACGAYDEALKHYKMAELNTLAEKQLPVRSLRIVAESYAIKGLCLEQSTIPGSTSRYKQAEKDNEMIRSFELASDLTLLYLQRAGAQAPGAGATLETALQRVPILHIRAGRLQSAIERYREMLMAVESAATQALRLTLARQLAEVLMRGVTRQVYKAPDKSTLAAPQGTLTRRREEYASEGPWKPKKYAGLNQFIPQNKYEEVFLILVVGEAMGVRDAVLSQSAEFEAARAHSLNNAVALIDLLCVFCARWRTHGVVCESLEHAMKFSFNCAHIWRQRALATHAARHAPPHAHAHAPAHAHAETSPVQASSSASVRARGVVRVAAALAPADAPLRLLAAGSCYSDARIEEGIEYAQQALRIEEEGRGPLLARCCMHVGVGYQMKAQKSNCRKERDAANEVSLKHLVRAVQLDDNDHLAFYYLALQYSRLGMSNEAMDCCRACLRCRAECLGGLSLVSALLARGAGGSRAAALARAHYPRAPLALQHAARAARDPAEALSIGKELLQLLYSPEMEEEAEINGYAEMDAISDSNDALSNRDGASIRAESTGAPRLERALSAGGASAGGARRAPLAARQAEAWLLMAELCLRLERVSAAAGCVSEATALTPYSHLVFHMRGLVHAASREWDEARQCFQNALAIHPTHVDSIVQLGTSYYNSGWLRLAEKCFREALHLQPYCDAWRRLALVLAALHEPAAAADCAAAALQHAQGHISITSNPPSHTHQ